MKTSCGDNCSYCSILSSPHINVYARKPRTFHCFCTQKPTEGIAELRHPRTACSLLLNVLGFLWVLFPSIVHIVFGLELFEAISIGLAHNIFPRASENKEPATEDITFPLLISPRSVCCASIHSVTSYTLDPRIWVKLQGKVLALSYGRVNALWANPDILIQVLVTNPQLLGNSAN